MKTKSLRAVCVILAACVAWGAPAFHCLAQPGLEPSSTTDEDDPPALKPKLLPDPENATAMPKPDRVWVDAKNHLVYVDGYISLREGYLEMFACLTNTKEHESIVAAQTRAKTVHAALLAVGAVPGHPVRYQPKFSPAAGTEIDVEVRWLDDAGKWKSVRAQDWIRNLRTKKMMTESWVFAGSGFWKNEETGNEHYMAETGDFICVSNFTTAMMDLSIESSQSNDGLLFVAEPKAGIPPLGTPVRLVLTPKLEKKDAK